MSSDQFASRKSFTEGLFSTANNPVACMFHIGFKGLSLFSFIFLNAFLGNDILTFIVVVVFASFDFWTVKNITGRLLVNLRWWSEIDEYGNEQWIYESEESRKVALQAALQVGDVDEVERLKKQGLKRAEVGATDSYIFWTALYLTPMAWAFFFIVELFSFKFFWMVATGVCFSLSFMNAQGFYYCRRDHKEKLSDYIQERGMNMFVGAAKSGVLSNIYAAMPNMLPAFLRKE